MYEVKEPDQVKNYNKISFKCCLTRKNYAIFQYESNEYN